MSNNPEKCVVLVPVGSSIEPACEEGLRELEQRGYPVRRVRGFSAIDQGRCQLATDALADGFDETMWIDSDIGFNPDAVERLRSHNLPFTVALYPQKGRRALACHAVPGTKEIVFGVEGRLIPVRYAGTGFMHVRRTVYETIQHKLQLPTCNSRFGKPLVPWFLPLVIREHWAEGTTLPGAEMAVSTAGAVTPLTHWYLAEDFAFCERARRCGIELTADTTIRLNHFGSYGYTWENAGRIDERFESFKFHLD